MRNKMITFLTNIGFKLIGSQKIGLQCAHSDYDFATSSTQVFDRAIKILKKKLDVVEGGISNNYIKQTNNVKFEYEGKLFDLHLVEEILSVEEQFLLHYEQKGVDL